MSSAPAGDHVEVRPQSIFELLTAYHRSLESMRSWLDSAGLDDLDRIGIVDAWQSEMQLYFHEHGYCFACNRALERCRCG